MSILQWARQHIRGDLGTVRNCFFLLSRQEIRRLRLVALAQLVLALLDFLGVVAIGLVGALSVNGIQSKSPSGQLNLLLDLLGIENWTFQGQVAVIGIVAGFILVIKTFISAWITRRTITFLANRSASISTRILEKLVYSNFEQIKKRSRFENMFALNSGVQSITVGVIGTMMGLVADGILIAVMFFGLIIVDPTIALFTVGMFGSIALILYRLVNKKVTFLANEDANFQIRSGEMHNELFASFREIFAAGTRDVYVDRLAKLKLAGAKIYADSNFIPNISKYVLEVAFVIGAICFVGFQFLFKDAIGAISSISVFLAAAGRIVPAILRLQGAGLTFRGSLVSANRTLRMIEELKSFETVTDRHEIMIKDTRVFIPEIVLDKVSFRYTDSEFEVIREVSLTVKPGEWLAVVGPSGAGKTTLVDLILGILKPMSGEIRISGFDAEIAVTAWPGSVSYVPQESFIYQGSIEQNVALGQEDFLIDSARVHECLRRVGLEGFIESISKGTKMQVGESGSRISGGQKQRLGIARALYSNPKLIVFDEATSALDTTSERVIIDCLNAMKGKTTIISIAHRLSTVVNADKVAYLENGRLLALGSFEEVRRKIPNFDHQANLANIKVEK